MLRLSRKIAEISRHSSDTRVEETKRGSGGRIRQEPLGWAYCDAKVVVVKNSGHWLMEEQPEETMAALLEFLS